MIEVTPVAADKLRELRQSEPTRTYLRLFVAGRTCSGYQYGLALDDKVEEQDAVSELNGIRVAVDPVSQPYCDGATIDFISTPDGEGFIVRSAMQVTESEGGGCGGSCSCGH